MVETKPYATRKLYVEPGSPAAHQADLWRTADPEGARLLDAVAKVPRAHWIGDWTHDPTREVDQLLTAAGDQLCVLVLYNVPHRDCGDYSAGGAHTAAEYRAWIAKVAAGIKGREVIVWLEPDGLSVIHCLDPGQLAERHAALAVAVSTLTSAGARVYIDAGCSHWVPAKTMAAALTESGIAGAAGFGLGCAHFQFLRDDHAFAAELRAILGNTVGYILDSSRNGRGPYEAKPGEDEDREWCNPPGRGCGQRPTLQPATAGCHARLWIKTVGASDGALGGDPPAGAWFPSYARALAANAVPKL